MGGSSSGTGTKILAVFVMVMFLLIIVMARAAVGMLIPEKNPESEATPKTTASACGSTVETLVAGVKMVPTSGKLGYEEHLTGVTGQHYEGVDSQPLTFAGGDGAFAPHTPDQERWYFNSQWGGWNWEPTRKKLAPTLDHSPGSVEARNKAPHAKLIVTSVETKKSIVVSAEESGPALWVTDRDGINMGAPPEVYSYLGSGNPYSSNPSDNLGKVTVGFAKDQNIKLGPCN